MVNLALLAGLFCLVPGFAAGAASFTASLDRDTLTLGESATMTLSFEGGSPAEVPTPPSDDNVRVQDLHQISSSFNFVNGAMSQTESHTFLVTPLKVGTYDIPAMTVRIGNQTCKSQPVRLTVLKPGAPPPAAATGAPKTAFLKLLVTKDTVYIGEVLPIEIQLFCQALNGAELPHVNEQGFTLGKMVQQNTSSSVVNGQQYNVITLKSSVVPAKVGKLDLGPATMSLQIPGAMGRDWFGRLTVQRWDSVTLESDPQTLQVLPLPRENVPPGFNGAVGVYNISVTAGPTNIAVGDPITIKIEITGRGALQALTLPAQTNWDNFKLYPPTSDFQSDDQLGISGTRTFALTAVPESTDIRELPPYSFSFFDPEQKCYRTMTHPATPLVVRPSAASLPPPSLAAGNNAAETAPTNLDIVHIKPRLGAVATIQPPLVRQTWFLALQGVPAFAWMLLLVRRKQAERLAGNPRLRRQRQVEQTVRNGFKDLQTFAAANQPTEFFATLFRLLQEQLGERLDLPASAITEAVLDERLRPLNVPDGQLDALRELFHACNQARYARQSTNAELVSLIPKTELALNQLKQLKT